MKKTGFWAVLIVAGLLSFGADAGEVLIGTGTGNGSYPMATNYYSARTQMIYLASEIGGEKTLTWLALDVATLPGQTMNNFTIRLKHTDLSVYGDSPAWDSSGWTTVYQANQSIYVTGRNTFSFTAPFAFNGAQNLIVDISFHNTSFSWLGYCRCSTLGTKRTLYYGTNTDYGSPLTWAGRTPEPTEGFYFSNVRLGYLEPGTGSGTAADPYQIWTAAQMSAVGSDSGKWNKYFILMADIDMQGMTLVPVGNSTTKFTGSFNGNQYIIRNAVINMSSTTGVGLFGYVGQGGQVYNLGVESATIVGSSSVGGLVGSNSGGAISNCFATGTVVGTGSNVGGLIGSNTGSVSNCYTIATVVGGENTGGLIGYINDGTVSNCYAAGVVTGGGLIGYLRAGTVTNSFWDTQASGYTTSTDGSGKTTAQMRDINTYLLGRWDFSYETFNGTQDIWTISPGQYPRLAWQSGDPEEIAIVPDVVLTTQTDAENAITAVGLTVWVTNAYSTTAAAGTVISQNPAVGTPLLAGMPVNIVVSLGSSNPGSGTETDPLRIGTIEDWQKLMSGSFGRSQNYILIADLDLRFVTLIPVANSSVKFTGFFNGNGHVIRNATINNRDGSYIGLFGYIDVSGRVACLRLESATMTGVSYVGGLAGISYGTISHCSAAGTVTGCSYSVGGLVGTNYGLVSHCSASGSVSVATSGGPNYIGGIVGYNAGTVSHCNATGFVSSSGSGDTSYAGGLIGTNANGMVNYCYATGPVTRNGAEGISSIGGLIGINNAGTANQCYATGNVSGSATYLGGLVGQQGFAINCYATGTVSGSTSSNFVGGLIGYGGAVSKCYSTGSVSGDASVGGLTGVGAVIVFDGFWDTQTSGTTVGFSGTGKTTAQMQTLSTFTDSGWDFAGETVNGTEDIWTISSGQYPHLAWQDSVPAGSVTVPDITSLTQAEAENALIAAGLTSWVINTYNGNYPAGAIISQNPTAGTIIPAGIPVNIVVNLGYEVFGSGTVADPYRIATITNWKGLMNISSNWNKHYILIADLDLRFVTLTPIGNSTTKFTGSFNGNGYVIRNATINASASDYVGLFGFIDTSGQVFDLDLDSAMMIGNIYVGGLAGGSLGTVTECDVTGDIVGNYRVGGLMGANGGPVSQCSMAGTVTSKSAGESYAGGLMGTSNGPVSDCHATGAVSGYSHVGGLVGHNYFLPISRSYSNCTVSACVHYGGLVGYNTSGHIGQCYSTGVINAYQPFGQYVGGLAGYNVSGNIEQCYSMSALKSSALNTYQYVGGLAGFNESGTIIDSYSTSAVVGSSYLGGLVASNGGTIGRCYSTGAVNGPGGGLCGPNSGSIADSFWDIETSGKATSGGGTGKTTEDMQTLSTFTGWDFAVIWALCEGTNYPRMMWQIPAGDWMCPDGVSVEDLEYFVGQWLMDNCAPANNYCGGADMDSSGVVNLADWTEFAGQWLEVI